MKILALSLLFFLGTLAGADVKITGLPPGNASSVGVNDVFPYVDIAANATKKMKIADLLYAPQYAVAFDGKASTALNNLSYVAINTDLRPGVTASVSLGAATVAFLDVYAVSIKDTTAVKSIDPLNRLLLNSSGVKLLDYHGSSPIAPSVSLDGGALGVVQLSAAVVGSTYQVVFPATGGSVGQILKTNGAGSLGWVYQNSLSVVNGGDASYSIRPQDGFVRATTALGANRTYTLPSCGFSNLGEQHSVKNPTAQGFDIILAAAGSDLIDGNATVTLNPGESVVVICGAFNGIGFWDIE